MKHNYSHLQPVLAAEQLVEELREGGVTEDGGHQVRRGLLGQLQEAAALRVDVQPALSHANWSCFRGQPGLG